MRLRCLTDLAKGAMRTEAPVRRQGSELINGGMGVLICSLCCHIVLSWFQFNEFGDWEPELSDVEVNFR